MAMIPLPRHKFAFVDDADVPAISAHRWYHRNGYTIAIMPHPKTGKPTSVLMHRFIMGVTGRKVVDHINGNRLDNRRSNLRIASRHQNSRNQKLHCDSRTGFKGVAWARNRRSPKKFFARIRVDKRQICLGYFLTREEAGAAYDKAAILHHGEFARTNAMIGPPPIKRYEPEDELAA